MPCQHRLYILLVNASRASLKAMVYDLMAIKQKPVGWFDLVSQLRGMVKQAGLEVFRSLLAGQAKWTGLIKLLSSQLNFQTGHFDQLKPA